MNEFSFTMFKFSPLFTYILATVRILFLYFLNLNFLYIYIFIIFIIGFNLNYYYFYPFPNPKQEAVHNLLLQYLSYNYLNLFHLHNYHNFVVQQIMFDLVKILKRIYYLLDYLLYNYLIINMVLFVYVGRLLFRLNVIDIF